MLILVYNRNAFIFYRLVCILHWLKFPFKMLKSFWWSFVSLLRVNVPKEFSWNFNTDDLRVSSEADGSRRVVRRFKVVKVKRPLTLPSPTSTWVEGQHALSYLPTASIIKLTSLGLETPLRLFCGVLFLDQWTQTNSYPVPHLQRAFLRIWFFFSWGLGQNSLQLQRWWPQAFSSSSSFPFFNSGMGQVCPVSFYPSITDHVWELKEDRSLFYSTRPFL